MAIGLLCCVYSATAQEPPLQQKVSLQVKRGSLEKALETLSAQYQLSFSYSNEVLSRTKPVTVQANEKPLQVVLAQLLNNTGLTYSLIGSQIVIEPALKKKEEAQATVSGKIRDSASGELLAGATIYVMGGESIGATANAYGFYSLTLPKGKYQLKVFYLGYNSREVTLTLEKNQPLNIELTPAAAALEEVVISSDKDEPQVMDSRGGRHLLPMQTVKSIPAVGGESDAVKALQMLPGVQTANEGTTNLSVRGGSFDQNLILLDEAPVYNVSHLFGFFSIFNNDAIKEVSLLKGCFPATYGGRASSVMDIRMQEGNTEGYHAQGGIGLLSSRLTVQGPIPIGNKKLSFLVSGRRSYIDKALGLVKKNVPYYFYDTNVKL
ncbi:MAG: carboxypeptidase-like regulatory domain-containing protein, partial [Rufibacter sp.]